jgi:hypothetical protein
MAIKKVTFSFDVPVEELLALVMTRNAGLRVDVFGTDKSKAHPKQLNGHPPQALLEAPKRKRHTKRDASGNVVPIKRLLLKKMLDADNHSLQRDQLKSVLTEAGYSAKSLNNQIGFMRKDGFAKRTAEGIYQLTANGLRAAKKLDQPKDAQHA